MNDADVQRLQAQIDKLAARIPDAGFTRFTQQGITTLRLQLKNFATAPSPANVGEVAMVAGVLKVCTAGGMSPTWTTVGTQT